MISVQMMDGRSIQLANGHLFRLVDGDLIVYEDASKEAIRAFARGEWAEVERGEHFEEAPAAYPVSGSEWVPTTSTTSCGDGSSGMIASGEDHSSSTTSTPQPSTLFGREVECVSNNGFPQLDVGCMYTIIDVIPAVAGSVRFVMVRECVGQFPIDCFQPVI